MNRKQRRKKAKMDRLNIRASEEERGDMILCSGREVEFIAAAKGDDSGPKRFSMVAYTGGKMNVGWGDPVVVELSSMQTSGSRPILKEHSKHQIVGHSDRIAIEGSNLIVEGVISGSGPAAKEVLATSANGFPWQASIGSKGGDIEFVREGTSISANGMVHDGPLLFVRNANLKEVSFVALGADDKTSASVAAALEAARASTFKEGYTAMDFHKWLKASGFDDIDSLGEKALATLKASYEAEQTAKADERDAGDPGDEHTAPAIKASDSDEDGDDPVAVMRLNAAAELERQNSIQAACADKGIAAKAIRENWSVDKAQLEDLKAARPDVPNAIVRTNDPASNEVVEAALCMQGKLAGIEASFDEKTLDAASTVFRHGIGLQEVLLRAAQESGCRLSSMRGPRAIREVLQAAFSTASLPGILSNTANKFLLEGFGHVEDSWKEVAAIRPVNDFKTITSYRLDSNLDYKKVGPDGELEHGEVGESSFTNKADTYGRMLSITRQMIIDDDLSAMSQLPFALGRGAALKFNEVFWTEFLDNASFFASGNSNFLDGTASALGVDALTAAEVAFLDQTDTKGKPLGTKPAILLVPNAQNVTADLLMSQTEYRDTTASTKSATKNPHSGKYKKVRSTYLSDATLTGFSTLAWYLLADPRDRAAIEVALLNGQMAPTIETADADFNTLGIQMRGYHDFGVTKQDFRAGVKSKGEA